MACSMRLFSAVLVLVTLLIVTEMALMAVEGRQDRDSYKAKLESKTNKNNCKKYVPNEVQSHCIYDTNSAGNCRELCTSSGFSDAECIDGKCMCVNEICDTKKQDRDSPKAKKKLHKMKQSETAKNHEAKHESKTNKHKCKKYVPCKEQSHCIYDTNSAGDCREFCMSSGFSDAECIDGKCMCVKEICDTKKQDHDSHEAKKKLHKMKQSETAKNHEAKHESKTNKHKCKKYVPCKEQSHCIYDTNSAGDCREFCMSSGFSDAECIDGKCMCVKEIC